MSVSRFPALAIKSDGTLWTWGAIYDYSTGLPGYGNFFYSSPIQVGSQTDWSALIGSDGFSFAKKTDGTLWGTGKNIQSQLGLPSTNASSPVRIGTATDWQLVNARSDVYGYEFYYRNHSSAIKSDNSLWVWGYQAGLTPTQVGTSTDWSRICSVGESSSFLALKTDGTIWSQGNNFYGWLGLGDTTSRLTPTQIGTSTWIAISGGTHCFGAIRSDGTLWMWGTSYGGLLSDFYSSPVQIGSQTSWATLSVGSNLVLLKHTNGTLWSWNGTSVSQIGTASDWSKIFTYTGVHMAIKTNKSLWVWGTATNGELGQGATTSYSTPVQLGTENKWLLVALGYGSSMGIKHS